MNTKELLQQAIANLKEENNAEASQNVEAAKKADVENTFEALADKLYSDLLIEDESVANKFKNLYTKYVEVEEEKSEQPETVVVNNNTTNKSGTSVVTWIIMIIIVLVVIYFGSQLFSVSI